MQEVLADRGYMQGRSFPDAPKALPKSLRESTKATHATRLISSGYVILDPWGSPDGWDPRGDGDVYCVDDFDDAVCHALNGRQGCCPIPVLTWQDLPRTRFCHAHLPLALMLYSKRAAAVIAAAAGRHLPPELCGHIARLACLP